MKKTISYTLQRALEGIARTQNKDGGFSCLCSNDPQTMTGEKTEALFPNCLILSSLAEVHEKNISLQLAQYILKQKSTSWSWNYNPLSKKITSKHYPDDLDDTFCALIGLVKTKTISLSPDDMAHITHLLIKNETTPGGPYRTWIIDTQKTHKEVWNDVDIVVNANIACFLGMQGIFLEPLHAYIRDKVIKDDFTSLYYHSKIVIAYFISRYIQTRKDIQNPEMKSFIHALEIMALDTLYSQKPCYVALSVVTLHNIGKLNHTQAYSIQNHLEKLQESDGLWPAADLYRETIRNTVDFYCGSRMLTSAFCIEALTLCEKTLTSVECPDNETLFFEKILSYIHTLFLDKDKTMQKDVAVYIKKFKEHGMDHFIALLPYHFRSALAYSNTLDDSMVITLGAAHMLGWIGYTIQDTIVDEGKDRNLLPLSNVCLRESLALFEMIMPPSMDKKHIRNTFNRMDYANAQEINAHEPAHQKSLGHALGPLIMLACIGFGPETKMYASLENFFISHLSARQMNDDAHDWEEDLLQSRTNSVLKHIDIQKDIETMRRDFWNISIDKIVRAVFYQTSRARKAAKDCKTIINMNFFETLLKPIETSASRALSERNKGVEFLNVFEMAQYTKIRK